MSFWNCQFFFFLGVKWMHLRRISSGQSLIWKDVPISILLWLLVCLFTYCSVLNLGFPCMPTFFITISWIQVIWLAYFCLVYMNFPFYWQCFYLYNYHIGIVNTTLSASFSWAKKGDQPMAIFSGVLVVGNRPADIITHDLLSQDNLKP